MNIRQREPKPPHDLRRRLQRLAVLVFTLGCVFFADATVQADNYDDRRVRAGARLFRSLLAADTALETRAGTDGTLHVVVLGGDAKAATEIAVLIAPVERDTKAQIRNMPLLIDTRVAWNFADASTAAPAGIFLAVPPPAPELDKLVRWAIEHHVILYSPFEGHVERGATAGLSIEAKVQPYVNAKTLEASGIELKPFFLKVAKVFR